MKKSLVVTLALVFVLGIAGTAFANPYSDVPAGHWAYKAVVDLQKAGVMEGANGKFMGNQTLTRYEIAAITARAMAKADKADAATKATIDKLAVEFSKELNDLGVRVAKLEKQQSNVKIGGNVRLRYEDPDDKDANGVNKQTADTQKLRVRIDVNAQINEDWKVFGRLEQTENFLKSGKGTAKAGDADEKGNTFWDQIYVQGKMGDTQLTAGRISYVPVFGMVADTYIDGAKLAFNLGDVKTNLYYGREDDAHLGAADPTYAGAEFTYSPVKELTLIAAYHNYESDDIDYAQQKGVEFGLGYQLAPDWKLSASYAKFDVDKKYDAAAYNQDTAANYNLKYKGANLSEVGTWGAWAQYSDLEKWGTYDTTLNLGDGYKGYEVGFEYVPFKNGKLTTLYVDYEPANDAKKAEGKLFRTQLEVFF